MKGAAVELKIWKMNQKNKEQSFKIVGHPSKLGRFPAEKKLVAHKRFLEGYEQQVNLLPVKNAIFQTTVVAKTGLKIATTRQPL